MKCDYEKKYTGNLYECNAPELERASCKTYVSFGYGHFCSKYLIDKGKLEKDLHIPSNKELSDIINEE
jgi:hypothetical protein